MTTISANIRKARGKRSLREVGRKAKMGHEQVGRVETNAENMTLKVIRRVANAVGLEITTIPKP